MDHTKNHHLPQWVESDRILMSDFNNAMASIEAGLNSNAQEAAAAKTAAQEAKAAAADPAKPYAVGTYTGTAKLQSILLGFKPSFIIISGEIAADGSFGGGRYSGATGGTVLKTRCLPTDFGFNVFPADESHPEFPNLNEPQRVYEYIAFR